MHNILKGHYFKDRRSGCLHRLIHVSFFLTGRDSKGGEGEGTCGVLLLVAITIIS